MRRSAHLLAALMLVSGWSLQAREALPSFAAEAGSPTTYTLNGKAISTERYEALQVFNDSMADFDAGRWAPAESKLRKSISLDSGIYQAHSNLAVVLLRTGRVDEAAQEADKAFKLAPDKPETLSTLAGVKQAQGKLEDAAKLWEEFATRFPNHRLAAQARTVAVQFRNEAKAHKAIESRIGQDSDNDYFAYATRGAVAKWPANRMPLKVYIPNDTEAAKADGYRKEFGEALRAAFPAWESASQGAVRFEFVPDADKADIQCKWTSNFSDVQDPTEGGEANVVYDPYNGIRSAKIILLTRIPATGLKELTPKLIKGSCLHEIGHSIGLLDHSPNPGDIMYLAEADAEHEPKLSQRDANTICHLYRSDVQLAQKHDGGINMTNKAALNNEGLKYASARQYQKAAEYFEAALKLDPNCMPAQKNLASCLNNLGIDAAKAGKLDEAATDFRKAMDLEGPNGDKNKLIAILQNLVRVYQGLSKTTEANDAQAQLDKLTSAQNAANPKAK